MFVVVALIVAAGVPASVSAACEVEPWSEWSSCEPKTDSGMRVRGGRASVAGAAGVAFVDLGCPSCDPPVAAAEAVEDFVETATWRSDWRDLKVYDHYALIVSEAAGHGLQIFDLERLDPSHARHDKDGDGFYDPDARTTFGGSLGSAHNVVVNEETARAYAVGVEGATGSSTCNGGLLGVDIRDPTMPKWLGCLFDDAYVHDAQCVVYRGPDVEHFGREICFLSTESEANYAGGLRILDISNAELDGGSSSRSRTSTWCRRSKETRGAAPGTCTRSWRRRVVVNEMNSGMAIVKPTGLLVETRSRRVTARSADDVCPNLFQERSCAAATEPATAEPTTAPTAAPSTAPTAPPSTAPTVKPSDAPSAKPTDAPSAHRRAVAKPTARRRKPTAKPTARRQPTAKPTGPAPSAKPTAKPTGPAPTAKPTAAPSPRRVRAGRRRRRVRRGRR
ncbi:hypothetical protein JL720_11967 [Aureococcus anophagefferens]|nr:hypothetical protein JL720_11967 [Aureococcus anophagefferens]